MTHTVIHSDCLQGMRMLPDNFADSIVTDPPYGLEFMGKKWDAPWKSDRRQTFDGTLGDVRENPFGRSKVRYGVGASYGGQVAQMRAFQQWATEIFIEGLRVLKPGGHVLAFGGPRTYHRLVSAVEDAGFEIRDQIAWVFGSGFPKSHNGEWGGTAFKPAHEPIVVARKPLEGTVEANWRKWGTGALNIDGGRTAEGRWPANLIHDGSDEVLAAFPAAPGQQGDVKFDAEERKTGNVYGAMKRGHEPRVNSGARRLDSGSAARFFYCAKASKADRNEGLDTFVAATVSDGRTVAADNAYQRGKTERLNTHPTVKPTDLMRYLCRLVTPPGGLVLDPFTGSGSTGKAAALEGFNFFGFELDPAYVAIAQARIAAALLTPM